MENGKWKLKQMLKMMVQHVILPVTYDFWHFVYLNKRPDKIVFADAHHDSIPFSMQVMHEKIEEKGYVIEDWFYDYAKLSMISTLVKSMSFMRIYARARYVFICDNFLPVASCRKSRKTKIIQLWHSCGLLKKMGYDTAEDVPEHYIGNVYKNYNLVTVSAPCCVPFLTSGMKQSSGIVQALGVSRTDVYFDKLWIQDCRQKFYEQYPAAKGKTIILWAPTFRGNAADPYLVGTEGIQWLEEQLGEEYLVIRKVHPHIEKKYHLSNCSIPTERLLPITDLMITDYSSVVFDYVFFERPYIMYAPDWEEYEKKRGFYVPYPSLSPYVIKNYEELPDAVEQALMSDDKEWIKASKAFHVGACDGKVSERIMETLGL